MQKAIFIIFLLITNFTFSQINEGQNFCTPTKDGEYFPLSIDKKRILWQDKSYFETKNDSVSINGKIYIEYLQDWGENNVSKIYLREENGTVYQYKEESKKETIRFDKSFKKGHTWKTADGKCEYKIISFKGKLETPFCKYENLLIIRAKFETVTFNFYYLKGHGYVGATVKDKIMSCVSPNWND